MDDIWISGHIWIGFSLDSNASNGYDTWISGHLDGLDFHWIQMLLMVMIYGFQDTWMDWIFIGFKCF